jgi:uncharacterized protein with HEPN domain
MPHGHDLEARLHDILDEIKGIRDATAGLSLEIFKDVWVIRRASERSIEIISEASRHIPEDLRNQHQISLGERLPASAMSSATTTKISAAKWSGISLRTTWTLSRKLSVACSRGSSQ